MKRYLILFVCLLLYWANLPLPHAQSFGRGGQAGDGLAQEDNPVALYDVRWSGQWIGAPSTDGLWLFDTENLDADAEPLHYLARHRISTFAFDPLRPRIAAFDETTSYLRILDIETGESIEDIYIETPAEDFFPVVYDIQYSPDGEWLVVTTGARIHVFDPATSRLRDSFYFPAGTVWEWVSSITFGGVYGTIIAGNINSHVLVFNVGGGGLQQAIEVQHPIYRLEAVPGTDDLLIMDQGLSYYADTDQNSTLLDPKFETGVYGFDLNNTGDVVAVGMDSEFFLYSLTEKAIVQAIKTTDLDKKRVFGLAFSDDDTQLVTLDTAGHVQIWDAASGELVTALGNFSYAVSHKWG